MPVTTVEFDAATPADEHSKATRLYEAFVVACSEHGVTPEVVISVEVNFLRIRTPLQARSTRSPSNSPTRRSKPSWHGGASS